MKQKEMGKINLKFVKDYNLKINKDICDMETVFKKRLEQYDRYKTDTIDKYNKFLELVSKYSKMEDYYLGSACGKPRLFNCRDESADF